jgi:endonuclease YncB( thermonuclease family)
MRLRSVATQWTTVLVLLIAVAVIARCKPEWISTEVATRTDGGYHAIDGDSFSIGQSEIRLYGIDAPEYRQPCTDASGADVRCGRMARDALSKLIAGQNVKCRSIERDRYGRQVSICRTGTIEINREMVRLGWAIAYRKHALDYVSAEREAKAAKRGIWAMRFETPQDYRNRNRAVEGNLIKDE